MFSLFILFYKCQTSKDVSIILDLLSFSFTLTSILTWPHEINKGDNDSTGLNTKSSHSFILQSLTELTFNTQGEKKGLECYEAKLKDRLGFLQEY